MSIGTKHRLQGNYKFQTKANLFSLKQQHFQDIILLAENVDKDIGELFTFDEMFTKEYQPNDFTAKWLGGESCFVIVVCDFCNK